MTSEKRRLQSKEPRVRKGLTEDRPYSYILVQGSVHQPWLHQHGGPHHPSGRSRWQVAGDSIRGAPRMEKGAVHLQITERLWIEHIEVGLADRPSLPPQMGYVGRSRFLGPRCHGNLHAVQQRLQAPSRVGGYRAGAGLERRQRLYGSFPLIPCLLVFLVA